MHTLQTELTPYAKEHFPSNIRRDNTDFTRGTDMVTTSKLRRTTTEEKDKIIALYKEGYNGKQVAEKLGLSHHNVNYHICKFKKGQGKPKTKHASLRGGAGITANDNPKLSHRMSNEDKLKLMDLHVSGYNNTQIADAIGVHFSTPGTYFKRLKQTGQFDREIKRAHKRVNKQNMRGITPTDRNNGYTRKGQLVKKTVHNTPKANSLMEELKERLKEEVREEILRELLGK